MITISLPFPPSVNGYWRAPTKGKLAGRHLISAKGREYRHQALRAVQRQWRDDALPGRLSVSLTLYPPDRRKRDIDNYAKALLDALTHAGMWVDDEQIDELTIIRGDKVRDGQCVVRITELEVST